MRLRRAIAAVAVVGGAVAGYLTYVHYAHISPICTTGGCEKVQCAGEFTAMRRTRLG